MMCEPDWFFTLAVTAPSSTDSVKTLRKAYRTVVGRNVPARDQDDHLLLWIQVCSTLWVQDSVVEELRQILPCLPDLTWQNAAPIVGLDPSRGDEQLSGYPLQTLYLPTSFVHELLCSIRHSASYRNGERYYSRLGSCAVRTILTELGGFVYDTEDGLYILSFEFELRMVHNAALLILESERWPDQTKVRAQAMAEARCLAASNSRLGYSFPIHIVITDLSETTIYTYDPSPKTFYKRAHFNVEDFRVDPDLGDPTEDQTLQLLGMAGVLARALFCLMVEGYHDFIQATIRRFRLPLALQPCAVATERLNVYDEQSFMRHLRTIVQSTGVNVEHAVHVKAICHSLLSFIGFETGSNVDDKPRSSYYNLPNFPDLEFGLRVEDTISTESDTPDMMVTLQWRQHNTDWQLGGSWSLCFETFFTADLALSSNFEEIEDSGFLSRTRYAEFRNSMQVELLQPLWDSIRETISGTETEALERSLALIEEAKTVLSNPHGTPEEEERGVEKLRDSVRLLPWGSQFFSDEDIRARVEEVQHVQLSYVAR
ncbi:hypothetical protein ARMGADRAFT_733802 [Armillaria gallica]|uniref:Uncharacterized protein n=1 Tax=Armillaria gallica TaxID=47427 RepID=A0A2H3D0D8_ARMGA|nr:hypothetical protein ARMGADRAFT_733802 [Armillaria gallica]